MPSLASALATTTFLSTGGTALRTLPGRLADFINVKDFGALGNSTNGSDGQDDTAYIQAAIDWTVASDRRGTIAFPTGWYRTTAPLTLTANTSYPSYRLLGLGGAKISGAVNGWLIDRNVNTYQGGIWVVENLHLNNSYSGGGGIRTGACLGFGIKNCAIVADHGILSAYSASDIDTSGFEVSVDSCILFPQNQYVGTAIVVGNNSTVRDCDATGFDVAFRAWGHGATIIGGRSEVNNTGILLGRYGNGTTHAATGVCVFGHTWESNTIGLHVVGANSLLLGGGELNGFAGAAPGSTDPTYGIRIEADGLLGSLLSSTKISVNAAGAKAFSLAAGSGDDKFSRCVGINSSNSVGSSPTRSWEIPSNGVDMAYSNCNNSIGGEYPYLTFAQLPASGSVYAGREFRITDANISGKVLGDTITVGGAAGVIKVVWTGTVWRWSGY